MVHNMLLVAKHSPVEDCKCLSILAHGSDIIVICVGLVLTANWSAGLGTQSDRAFPVAAACLWNSHPSDIAAAHRQSCSHVLLSYPSSALNTASCRTGGYHPSRAGLDYVKTGLLQLGAGWLTTQGVYNSWKSWKSWKSPGIYWTSWKFLCKVIDRIGFRS